MRYIVKCVATTGAVTLCLLSGANTSEASPPTTDTDSDGVTDAVEVALGTDRMSFDTDGDSIPDNVELSLSGGSGPFAAVDTDGDGEIDAIDADSDNDCSPDVVEGLAGYRAMSIAPDASCGMMLPVCDTSRGRCTTACLSDSDCGGYSSGTICDGSPQRCIPGCRGASGNTCLPGYSCSSNTAAPGVCSQPDSDGDGIGDIDELAIGTNPNSLDSDSDGIPDAQELTWVSARAQFAGRDSDGDGRIDATDADSDNDGITDSVERGAGALPRDSDDDGVPDYLDVDSDNDGLPDLWENGGRSLDMNGDGRIDILMDSDGDGVLADADLDDTNPLVRTSRIAIVDTDGDDSPDYLDLDSDDDGFFDVVEALGVDLNSDGKLDAFSDADSDGLAGAVDPSEGGMAFVTVDTDSDGLPDFQDADDDGDSILTKVEFADSILLETSMNLDVDGDGKKNWRDRDSDGDCWSDGLEGRGDNNGNGIPEYLDRTPVALDGGMPLGPCDEQQVTGTTDGGMPPSDAGGMADASAIPDAASVADAGPNVVPPSDAGNDATGFTAEDGGPDASTTPVNSGSAETTPAIGCKTGADSGREGGWLFFGLALAMTRLRRRFSRGETKP